jgi:hypothetical protein
MESHPCDVLSLICVRPICATYWTEPDDLRTETPTFAYLENLSEADPALLSRLTEAVDADRTAWIETYLDGLCGDKREWFEGQFNVWDSMDNPDVDWSPMESVLKAVRLNVPPASRTEGEEQEARLLRAIPYGYTRGTFGTVRDALSTEAQPDAVLPTIFPIVGFQRGNDGSEARQASYVAIRAVVAVTGSVVISMRLPDLLCSPAPGADEHDAAGAKASFEVPRRFLPLRRNPAAPDIAEAIGIHQATTARGVCGQIRDELAKLETDARRLNDGSEIARRGSKLQTTVRRATEEIDHYADIAQSLNRQISLILRRLGGAEMDAQDPAAPLVPAEVRRRYKFALEEVHSLREDCRLAADVAKQALSIYDQRLHERFQGFATLLASAVLIPTLVVGIFGVSVKVPAENSSYAFPGLVGLIAIVSAVTYVAFQEAHSADSEQRSHGRLLPAAIALFGVALLATALVVSKTT